MKLSILSSASQVYCTMRSISDLCNLTSLEINFVVLGRDAAVPQAMAAVADALSNSPIRNIGVFWSESYCPGLLPFDALRPWFRFRALEVLSLEQCPHPSFDDAMIAELARAFPGLHVLCMYWERPLWISIGAEWDTNVTFQGLSALLRHCPKLKKLTLAVDVTEGMNPNIESSLGGIFQTELTTWEVRDSLISRIDIKYVARTLSPTKKQ
ncbi:hypothetical protein CONPUDRAFT_166524 [Coniophora puteana RWD-64-598 SS2]|uniref:F-box domain-containing protein n=1 Tax=Coniophora puteana (strain RWD-64-598) TaxID=741705 RepID=A0A5M3MKR7_CONPW|nr:uncharacterized protein CONPUDRAFT_166524 [Coniophora puteana RWD-64-598 SS2]EIW79829.1 hypothetical protein CONPUDRAFT_166524 [Coniophora puteana RWD-64-598 SS2]